MADINTFGNPTYFNNDVTFYKDVTIGGEFKYDNLSVKTLSVGDDVKVSSGIVTATTFYGDAGNMLVDGSSLSTAITGIGAIVPSGVIVMWSGTTIPSGWALCDGTNSTPDLRNRFIVGANDVSQAATTTQAGPGFNATTGAINDTYTPGDTGGKVAHKLTVAEMPSHNHPLSGGDYYWRGDESASDDFSFSGSSYELTTSSSVASQGGSKYHENRPPYYALAFIMKI